MADDDRLGIEEPRILLTADGRGHWFAATEWPTQPATQMVGDTKWPYIGSEWKGSPEAALVCFVEALRDWMGNWSSDRLKNCTPVEVVFHAWAGRMVR